MSCRLAINCRMSEPLPSTVNPMPIPIDVLRPARKFDASPHGRDLRILEPNLESGD
jgi:hypothetical protein